MLSGQVAPYTFKQLKDYQSGDRKHKKMREATEKLTDEQLADLSAWFASRPLPVPELDAEVEVREETRQLVFKGDKTRLIQPCAACHSRAPSRVPKSAEASRRTISSVSCSCSSAGSTSG